MVIRILGLDNGNHVPMFREEYGRIFHNTRELVGFLSCRHSAEYDVRMFSIAEEYTGCLEACESDEVDQMFCYLQGFGAVTEKEPGFIFDLFWDSANKTYW